MADGKRLNPQLSDAEVETQMQLLQLAPRVPNLVGTAGWRTFELPGGGIGDTRVQSLLGAADMSYSTDASPSQRRGERWAADLTAARCGVRHEP